MFRKLAARYVVEILMLCAVTLSVNSAVNRQTAELLTLIRKLPRRIYASVEIRED